MTLLAHWKLQDNIESTAISATVGSDGTLTGAGNTSASSNTSGPGTALARCLLFDGVNDYVQAITGNSTVTRNKSIITLMCWFYATTADTTGNHRLVFSSNGDAAGTTRVSIGINSSGKITAVARAGDAESGQTKTSSSSYDDGVWHHVAVVYDFAGDSITIYIDGSSVSSTGTIAFTASATSNTSALSLTIASANTSEYFKGRLADVRIYDSDESSNLTTIMSEKDTGSSVVQNLGSKLHIMFPGRQWLVYPGTTGTDARYSLVGLYSAGDSSGTGGGSGVTFVYLDGISPSRTSSFGTLNIIRTISGISTTRTALFGTIQFSGSGGSSITGTGILVNYGDKYYISNNNGSIGGIFRPNSMAFDAGLTTGYSTINGNIPFSSISGDYTRRFKNEIKTAVPTGTNYAIYVLDTGGIPVNLTSYTQSVVLVKPNGDNVRIVPNYITNGADGGMYIQTTGLNMNGKWTMYIELNNWQSDRYRFEIRGN